MQGSIALIGALDHAFGTTTVVDTLHATAEDQHKAVDAEVAESSDLRTLVSELDGPRVGQIEAMLGHPVRRETVAGFSYAPAERDGGRRGAGRSAHGDRRAGADRGSSGGRKRAGGGSRGRRRAGGGTPPASAT